MKTKYLPIIGLDFFESENIRLTCFQLCRHKADQSHPTSKLEAVAVVDLNQNGEVERFAATPALKHREPAIIRLARKWQARSIPQRFPNTSAV